MDMAMDYQERGALQTSTASTVSTATLDRANQVLRETRQQFIDGFNKQCATIAALADEIVANPLSSDRAIKLLHGMAGLGGTIAIALCQQPLRSGLQPPNRRNGETHRARSAGCVELS